MFYYLGIQFKKYLLQQNVHFNVDNISLPKTVKKKFKVVTFYFVRKKLCDLLSEKSMYTPEMCSIFYC